MRYLKSTGTRVHDRSRLAPSEMITESDNGENRYLAVPVSRNTGTNTTLIDKVAKQPTHVTDEDIADVTASGMSEDQIFELVICAAVGEATRQYETALIALAEATADKPEE